MRACSISESTEDGVRSRPKFSAASLTIMNIRLYVLCCLLGSRAYTMGKRLAVLDDMDGKDLIKQTWTHFESSIHIQAF